jgi:hypothetical protein
LITGALAPLFLVFNSSFYSGVKLPICFLGFFFYGRSATLIFLAMTAAQLAAATGLLKLKRWGLFATIGPQCLTLLNFVLIVGIPANRLRFQEIMDAMRSSMDSRMHHTYSFQFPVWIGMVGSLPIIFAILWFLVAERRVQLLRARIRQRRAIEIGMKKQAPPLCVRDDDRVNVGRNKKGRPSGLPFLNQYDVCALRFDLRYDETESVQISEYFETCDPLAS